MTRTANSLPLASILILLTCPLCLTGAEAPAAKSAERQASPPAQQPHPQSEEIKAFRKTALPVSFPSNSLTLQGWIYKPEGPGPFPAVLWNHGSERNPTAHPELGKFYTSHGFALFLPVRHGHAPSPGEYIQDAIEKYAAEANDNALVAKKAVELQDVYQKAPPPPSNGLKSNRSWTPAGSP
jgi:hypothetical protein